jgi:multiple sugar transport system permease protein
MRGWGRTVVAAAVVIPILFPIYWLVLTAIQPANTSTQFPPEFLPVHVDLSGISPLFESAEYPMLLWLTNSVILSSLASLICIPVAVLGAYALVLHWRGRSLFAMTLLMAMALPASLLVVPILRLFREFDLVNNQLAVATLQAAILLPIGTWILSSAFREIPSDLGDAARVDGCGPLGVLMRVIVPLSVPSILAVSIIVFFAVWNEYLFVTLLLPTPDQRPAVVGISSLISSIDAPVQLILAAGLIFSIPAVILLLLVQRHFVRGLTAGAIKG